MSMEERLARLEQAQCDLRKDIHDRLDKLEQKISGVLDLFVTAKGTAHGLKYILGFIVLAGGALAVLKGWTHGWFK